jgi:hypothetical protein
MTWRTGATGWYWGETAAGRIVGAVQMTGKRYRCYLVSTAGEPAPIPGSPPTLAKAKQAVEKAAGKKR